ncbi:MAG: PAS domain-containing protein [Synergistaceae bacterium]|nr:PAS domain-containing protein [Synergistaceae bacterium]
MNHAQSLQAWVPLVDFLADAFGSTCEVVLHDLRNIEHSIIAIRNNHITGRKIGDSLSDYALEVIHKQSRNPNKNYVASYYGTLEESGKILRLSSFLIYDEENELMGLLALNMDFSALEEARNIIDGFINNMEKLPQAAGREEKSMHFNLSEDYMPSVIAQMIESCGVEPMRMTLEEKRSLVEQLQLKGIFLLKGAVTEVANKLEVSEQTVYRYLKDKDER